MSKLADMTDIPVEVILEVARFDINVQQLLDLQEGTVLEPPADCMSQVNVIAGGQVLAYGEVISQGAHYAVRIDHFAPQADDRTEQAE